MPACREEKLLNFKSREMILGFCGNLGGHWCDGALFRPLCDWVIFVSLAVWEDSTDWRWGAQPQPGREHWWKEWKCHQHSPGKKLVSCFLWQSLVTARVGWESPQQKREKRVKFLGRWSMAAADILWAALWWLQPLSKSTRRGPTSPGAQDVGPSGLQNML